MNYKIFIISILRNKKRYESLLDKLINEGFDKNQIEIFIGIDYKTVDKQILSKVISSWGIVSPKSVLCCALSHILLWRHISSLYIDYAIILEDDSYIIKNLFDKYQKSIESKISDSNFLNLSTGFTIKNAKQVDKNNLFINSKIILSLDTYILTPNLCKKLFIFYYNHGVSYHIDLHLSFIKKYVNFNLIHFNKKITKENLKYESSMVSDHDKKFILSILKDTETYKELNTPIVEYNNIVINGYICLVFLFFILSLFLTYICKILIFENKLFFFIFSILWCILGMCIYDIL